MPSVVRLEVVKVQISHLERMPAWQVPMRQRRSETNKNPTMNRAMAPPPHRAGALTRGTAGATVGAA